MLIADQMEKMPFRRPERGAKTSAFKTDSIRAKGRNRQRVKAWLKLGVLLLVAAAVVAGGVALYRAASGVTYFTVKSIRVSGTHRLDPVHVERTVSPLLMGNIFSHNLRRSVELLEQNPWVETVSVRKKLPDIAEVEVRERQPVALVAIGDLRYMIDAKGVIIAPADGSFSGIAISGLDIAQKPGEAIADPRLADVFRLIGVFELDTAFRDRPVAVDAGNPERIAVTTASGLLLKFGPDKDEWEERFMEYLAVRSIEADFGPGFAGYDLSFKNQMVAIVGRGRPAAQKEKQSQGVS